MKYDELLDVVDENDNVVGKETRAHIHAHGMMHREVHVWLYNDNREVLMQLRSSDVESFPKCWDASVGGHVDMGETYDEAAVKELFEETGLDKDIGDLTFLKKVKSMTVDDANAKKNNVFRAVYACKFEGSPEELTVEEGMSSGFCFWPIRMIVGGGYPEDVKFVSAVVDEIGISLLKEVDKLI